MCTTPARYIGTKKTNVVFRFYSNFILMRPSSAHRTFVAAAPSRQPPLRELRSLSLARSRYLCAHVCLCVFRSPSRSRYHCLSATDTPACHRSSSDLGVHIQRRNFAIRANPSFLLAPFTLPRHRRRHLRPHHQAAPRALRSSCRTERAPDTLSRALGSGSTRIPFPDRRAA